MYTQEGICIVKWRDRRDVLAYQQNMTEFDGRNK